MPSNPTRTAIVAEARTWLGTPFRHQGCCKGVGCDCIGLVKGVGLALNLVNYDPTSPKAQKFSAYPLMPDPQRMREGLAAYLVPLAVEAAQAGDILFLAWTKEPQHVALLTDKGIIHSYSGVGKVVEHALDDRWQRRVTAAYRYPALQEEV